MAEPDDPCGALAVDGVVASSFVVADVLAVVFVPVAAGADLPPGSPDNAPDDALDATELATISPPACADVAVTAGAAPWIRITAATTAVARTTAFFNVCTPIQRLHCPPI